MISSYNVNGEHRDVLRLYSNFWVWEKSFIIKCWLPCSKWLTSQQRQYRLSHPQKNQQHQNNLINTLISMLPVLQSLVSTQHWLQCLMNTFLVSAHTDFNLRPPNGSQARSLTSMLSDSIYWLFTADKLRRESSIASPCHQIKMWHLNTITLTRWNIHDNCLLPYNSIND